MLYEGRIDYETFTELYKQTEYEDEDKDDPKRNHAVEALARAALQTHTHGDESISYRAVCGFCLVSLYLNP